MLDSTTFEHPNRKLEAENIKGLLDKYKRMAAKRGLEIVKGPFASIQPRLFDDNRVDVIVRALVRPARKTRKRSETKKAGA